MMTGGTPIYGPPLWYVRYVTMNPTGSSFDSVAITMIRQATPDSPQEQNILYHSANIMFIHMPLPFLWVCLKRAYTVYQISNFDTIDRDHADNSSGWGVFHGFPIVFPYHYLINHGIPIIFHGFH